MLSSLLNVELLIIWNVNMYVGVCWLGTMENLVVYYGNVLRDGSCGVDVTKESMKIPTISIRDG